MPIAIDLYERRPTLAKTSVTLGRDGANVVAGLSASRRRCGLRVDGRGFSCSDSQGSDDGGP